MKHLIIKEENKMETNNKRIKVNEQKKPGYLRRFTKGIVTTAIFGGLFAVPTYIGYRAGIQGANRIDPGSQPTVENMAYDVTKTVREGIGNGMDKIQEFYDSKALGSDITDKINDPCTIPK